LMLATQLCRMVLKVNNVIISGSDEFGADWLDDVADIALIHMAHVENKF
jgi:hypothetical protein